MLQVLVICTANICRSPVGAQLIRDRAAGRSLAIDVDSAGFLEVGRPADPTMVSMARTRGVDVSTHRSQVVDETMVRRADVTVTMERRHARELVVLAPDVGHRVHTLLGLTDAGRTVPGHENLELWLRAVAEQRSAGDLMGDRGPDHIPDPYSRAKRHYRVCLDTLDTAVADLVELLDSYAH